MSEQLSSTPSILPTSFPSFLPPYIPTSIPSPSLHIENKKRDRDDCSGETPCTDPSIKEVKKRREWQLCDNWRVRYYMVDLIAMLLREKRPNATKEWQDKIPRIAQRLEEAIYYQSEKFDEYANPSTLKARLQQLALSVKGKWPPKNPVPDVAMSTEPQQSTELPDKLVSDTTTKLGDLKISGN
jgi:hypothetical protein